VRVGVGVLVKDSKHPNRIYAGIRKGSHGAGTLALPGGHLEMMEEWADCAKREVEEEMGIAIHKLRFCHVTNDPMESENKHYITIFMQSECVDADAIPQTMEPDKCEGWQSYSWAELKEILADEQEHFKLFGPLRKLVLEEPQAVLDFLQSQPA